MGLTLRGILKGVIATNPLTAPFFWGKKALDKANENPEAVKDTLKLSAKAAALASPVGAGVMLAKDHPDVVKKAGEVAIATNPLTAPLYWGKKAFGFLTGFFSKPENREAVINGAKTAAVVTNPVLLGAVGAKKLAENETVRNAVSAGARTLAEVNMATNPVTAPVYWGKKLSENPELVEAVKNGAKSADEVVNQVLDYPLDEAAQKAAKLYVEQELKKAELAGKVADRAVTGFNDALSDAQGRVDGRVKP